VGQVILSNKSDGFSEIGKHDKGNVAATFIVRVQDAQQRDGRYTFVMLLTERQHVFG
jgi:hypothetical protein